MYNTDSAERFCQTGPHIIVERLGDLKVGDTEGLGFPTSPTVSWRTRRLRWGQGRPYGPGDQAGFLSQAGLSVKRVRLEPSAFIT